MDERDIKNGMSKYDAIDPDGGDVAAMLSALPRVEAPGDFEFGVRSRIVVARDSKPKSTFVPFLKIAGPLTLILLVGAFLFYGTIPVTDPASIAVVPPASQFDENVPTAVAKDTSSQEASGPRVVEVTEPEDALAARRISNTTRVANNIAPRRYSRGGSIDMPMRGGSVDQTIKSGRTILPRGFESAVPRNLDPITNSSSVDVPVRDVLGILGVTADFANGGWSVRSVTDNSIAARSGVRAGDVIEAIDGQALKNNSKMKGSAKTFSVRRDGKQMNLTIAN